MTRAQPRHRDRLRLLEHRVHVRHDPRALRHVRPTTDLRLFEKLVAGMAAVKAFAFVTGRFDVVVELSRADAADLDATVRRLPAEGCVAAAKTRIVMRSVGRGFGSHWPGDG